MHATAPTRPESEAGYESLMVSAEDGLRLHARDYGPRASTALPLVCLPGLARTAADFHDLAVFFSTHAAIPRRVLALDYRGRGRSDRDNDWRRYDVRIELADTLQVLTAVGVPEAVFIGTSRGGLIGMGLATARPLLVRGLVLNDIGPVIEAEGLLRLRSYIGKLPEPKTLDEGAFILKRIMQTQFPRLDDTEWRAMAGRTWREDSGRLQPDYDPALFKTLEIVDVGAPLPVLWQLFSGLETIPVLAIRGALSDILSVATLEEMRARHPELESVTVPDQGHAPLLSEPEVLSRIGEFIDRIDPPTGLHGPLPVNPIAALP